MYGAPEGKGGKNGLKGEQKTRLTLFRSLEILFLSLEMGTN